MRLIFGTALDNRSFPYSSSPNTGDLVLGPSGLLRYLEQLCLSPYKTVNTADSHLRLDLARKVLQTMLEKDPTLFFAASFEVDPYGTSKSILERRDELLLAAFNFTTGPEHHRLHALSNFDQGLRAYGKEWPMAFADRFDYVRSNISNLKLPFHAIQLAEPLELLPVHLRELFEDIFSLHPDLDIQLVEEEGAAIDKDSDLFKIQDTFLNNDRNHSMKGDGSFQVWTFPTEADAAQYVSQIVQEKEPLFFIPDLSNTLDRSLFNNGQGSMGMNSSAPVRPGLMLLKSASVFLWNPLDLYKVIDFLKLPSCPFDKGLARELIKQFSDEPGFDASVFERRAKKYFDSHSRYTEEHKENALEEYNFWFKRDRYNAIEGCPIKEVINLYKHLGTGIKNKGSDNQHKQLLSKLCKQVIELLDMFEEQNINALQLERLINSIFQVAPITLDERSTKAYDFVSKATGIIQPAKEIIWWNCVQGNETYQFSLWTKKELDYLSSQSCFPDGPALESKQKLWRRIWPVLQAEERLILVVPHKVKGEEKEASNIVTDLQIRVEQFTKLVHEVNKFSQLDGFHKPQLRKANKSFIIKNNGFTHLEGIGSVFNDLLADPKRKLSYSAVYKLFYHPYDYVFNYLLKLKRSSIESIKNENRIKGVMGHYFFEKLFGKAGIQSLSEEDFEKEIDLCLDEAFYKSGSIFLLYGKEAEKQNLTKRLKSSAISFRKEINKNGWKVVSCEEEIMGQFNGYPFRGYTDMKLERQGETLIVDLKWYQSAAKVTEIQSNEDLQLILYALIEEQNSPNKVHTAYFMLKNGSFMARNEEALKDITVVKNKDNSLSDEVAVRQEVLHKMLKTFEWRKSQIDEGLIEMNLENTEKLVEDFYEDKNIDWDSLLEPKTPYERYDDYKNLIGLFN